MPSGHCQPETAREHQFPTALAAGELVFHVFAAIAHFERRLTSERTKDGPLAARKRGRTPGRPPLHADTVSALQELVDNGTSVTRAAGYLGTGRSAAYRVIRETGPWPTLQDRSSLARFCAQTARCGLSEAVSEKPPRSGAPGCAKRHAGEVLIIRDETALRGCENGFHCDWPACGGNCAGFGVAAGVHQTIVCRPRPRLSGNPG